MTNKELIEQLDKELAKVKADREAHSHIVRILQAFNEIISKEKENS